MSFDRFETTEGEYWLSQYKESAYNGLGVIYVHHLQNLYMNIIAKNYINWKNCIIFGSYIISLNGLLMMVILCLLYDYFCWWSILTIKKNWDQEFDLGEEDDHASHWEEFEDSNLYAEDVEIKQSRESVDDFDDELSWSRILEHFLLNMKHIWDEEFEYIGISTWIFYMLKMTVVYYHYFQTSGYSRRWISIRNK